MSDEAKRTVPPVTPSFGAPPTGPVRFLEEPFGERLHYMQSPTPRGCILCELGVPKGPRVTHKQATEG